MKIAIVNKPGSFSDRWLEYCKKNNIPYKEVNPYASDIVEQVRDCDAFMWHFHHLSYKDALFAKQLLFSIQQSGKKVFPDFSSAWHFDDKVGQQYLLESIDAPFIHSYVFYTKQEALKWIEQTTFPKVFKLRGGAGASNVKLVNTKREAKKIIKKAFSKGFKQSDSISNFEERLRKYKSGQSNLVDVLKGIVRIFIKDEYSKMHSPEKGYVYFQEFIPDNKFDIRVVIIGDKAFALKRMIRKNDFRASGSGNIVYDKNQIDERCIKTSFEVNEKIKSQSIAFDYVFDKNNNPLIVEISYGYSAPAYDICEGYWTKDLQWHEGTHFDFCGWMVENLINNK